MPKTIVIYHRSDFDGIFCREIARRALPDATLIGWEYNDPIPEVTPEDTLYILDLSVEPLMGHPNLVWIDHHKSAIERYSPDIPGYREDGVAACRLAWQYFNSTPFSMPSKQAFIDRTVSEPWAVRLAGEYDIWDKRDPNAELFQHGLRSQELSEYDWKDLLSNGPVVYHGNDLVDKLLIQGRALQYAKTKEDASIIKAFGYTVRFENLTFLACNHARFNSHLFLAGLTNVHDACMGYNWTGKHWRFSLYHAPGKESHDLSIIAVKYKGGGHRGACGFILPELPKEILTSL